MLSIPQTLIEIISKGIDACLAGRPSSVLGFAAGGQPTLDRPHAHADPRCDLPWRQTGLPPIQDLLIAFTSLRPSQPA